MRAISRMRQSLNPARRRVRNAAKAAETVAGILEHDVLVAQNHSRTPRAPERPSRTPWPAPTLASASTTCETHAPPETKACACSSCFGSSRAMSRTSTFVSAARIFFTHVLGDALVHLFDRVFAAGDPSERRPGECPPRCTCRRAGRTPGHLPRPTPRPIPPSGRAGGAPRPGSRSAPEPSGAIGRAPWIAILPW